MAPGKKEDDIVAITFKSSINAGEEISVLIEEPLNIDSSMEEVMKKGEVVSVDDDGYDNDDKVQIQKKSGGKLTLKWSKFQKMMVKRFIRIQGIDEDHIVIINF